MFIEFRLYSFVYGVKDYREHVMQFMNDINCIMSAGTKGHHITNRNCYVIDLLQMGVV